MKSRLAIILAIALGTASMAFGSVDDGHQSYISYDAGDSVLQQGFDGRTLEARVNLPVFPGDQIRTERRGRTEVRLADGNIVVVDRDSSVRFHSILESYEGSADRTVVEIEYGDTIIHRVGDDGEALRLDSKSASYLSDDFSLYRVRTDGYGRDAVAVFGGSVEVRTRRGTERVRAGETAEVDPEGRVRFGQLARSGMTDFERWYLKRSDRYNGVESRYVPGRIAYAESDLDYYGSWVYVNDYSSWMWRPRVSISWRPYFYGRWVSGPTGVLVWVSDEPWGWYPYHYGRWTYTSIYGWVWMPGSYYSPAWVYWAYGPSWIGWAPAGWYDCYRPYYPWLYHHYTPRVNIGVGFWGRIRLSDHDLHGWTLLDSNRIVSTRVDRAALTTDAIRDRLRRDGTTGTFSNVPARFSRDEIGDPRSAVDRIARRGIGDGTGTERAGSLPDATDFFRRDPELSSGTRERIVRSTAPEAERGANPGALDRLGRETTDSGSSTPTNVGRDDRVRGIQRDGNDAPSSGRTDTGGVASRPGAVGRGSDTDRISRSPVVDRPQNGTSVDGPEGSRSPRVDRPGSTDATRDDWRRGGVVGSRGDQDKPSSSNEGATTRSRTITRPETKTDDPPDSPSSEQEWRSTPAPRRVIDSIGGTKLVPRDDSSSGSSSRSTVTRPSSPSRSTPSSGSGSVSRDRSSGSDSSRAPSVRQPRSSSSSGSGSVSRSPSRSSSSTRSSGSSSSRSSGSSKSSSSSSSKKVERKRPN